MAVGWLISAPLGGPAGLTTTLIGFFSRIRLTALTLDEERGEQIQAEFYERF